MRPSLGGGGGGGGGPASALRSSCCSSTARPGPPLTLFPCRGGPASTSSPAAPWPGQVRRCQPRPAVSQAGADPGGAGAQASASPSSQPIRRAARHPSAGSLSPLRRRGGLTPRPAAPPGSPGPDSEPGPVSPLASARPSAGAKSGSGANKPAAAAGAGDARGPLATPGPLNTDPLGSADEDVDVLAESSMEEDADPALPPDVAAVTDAVATSPTLPTPSNADAAAAAADGSTPRAGGPPGKLYPPSERTKIAKSWNQLMRWSRKNWKAQRGAEGRSALDAVDKVVVFGGGSFGTAMAAALARQKPALDVVLLLRDPSLVADINASHVNARYLPGAPLPHNVRASAEAAEAIGGAQYALHAVPVQHSRAFLKGIRDLLPAHVPVISVSKGLEVGTGALMSDLIPDALGRKQPTAFLSGPSFAAEVMARAPTGLVAASRDKALKRTVQGLFASPYMRVNTSSDVVGVEVCGALKNVLAIASGIVEGLELGMNARAALVAQGCAEIRWLAEKMGAKPATVAGLSGLGDIMLTCYGSLSRNRSVGVRLGRGERLADILASSSQVAEGVATAGVVVALASRYHVQLPVLTAVAQVLAGALSPEEAVAEIMGLPQVEER